VVLSLPADGADRNERAPAAIRGVGCAPEDAGCLPERGSACSPWPCWRSSCPTDATTPTPGDPGCAVAGRPGPGAGHRRLLRESRSHCVVIQGGGEATPRRLCVIRADAPARCPAAAPSSHAPPTDSRPTTTPATAAGRPALRVSSGTCCSRLGRDALGKGTSRTGEVLGGRAELSLTPHCIRRL
jgi:hypothetical protein